MKFYYKFNPQIYVMAENQQLHLFKNDKLIETFENLFSVSTFLKRGPEFYFFRDWIPEHVRFYDLNEEQKKTLVESKGEQWSTFNSLNQIEQSVWYDTYFANSSVWQFTFKSMNVMGLNNFLSHSSSSKFIPKNQLPNTPTTIIQEIYDKDDFEDEKDELLIKSWPTSIITDMQIWQTKVPVSILQACKTEKDLKLNYLKARLGSNTLAEIEDLFYCLLDFCTCYGYKLDDFRIKSVKFLYFRRINDASNGFEFLIFYQHHSGQTIKMIQTNYVWVSYQSIYLYALKHKEKKGFKLGAKFKFDLKKYDIHKCEKKCKNCQFHNEYDENFKKYIESEENFVLSMEEKLVSDENYIPPTKTKYLPHQKWFEISPHTSVRTICEKIKGFSTKFDKKNNLPPFYAVKCFNCQMDEPHNLPEECVLCKFKTN